nr:hypothetical protein [uncultured Lachnoclostridium sp.]
MTEYEKKTIFILAIVAICMGSLFSSCQATSSHNPSQNEIDSTETSVEEVDSEAIIVKQKRIEAEKVAEAEIKQKKKWELERLAKNFQQKKDEFSNKTWILPKDKPKYRNRNATYCYFMKQSNEVSNFRFVFQYVNSDWLFIKDLIFNIDGKVFEYRRLDFNTDCRGDQIWEWCDLQLSDTDLIRALENAKSIKIKMNGDKYYDTRTLKSATITSIQNTIKYYKALGGRFY